MLSIMGLLRALRDALHSSSKLLSIVKVLSQCHLFLGVLLLILSGLADFISSRVNTVRLSGLEECCSAYFLIVGLVGLSGVASSRRGLISAFLIMAVHAIFIFVPAIIIASAFDIHFFKHGCYGECDWHLLATSMPSNSRCQILCGDALSEMQKKQMMRLGTDFRLDAGLIAGAICEFLLSILTVAFTARLLCISSGKLEGKIGPKAVEMHPLNGAETEEMTATS